ncbi:MAG: hypothetical protein IH984_10690 [Planctomycetes bacterium]|nr:hypothetical protein [Planctomycetota bacterium]
MADITKENIIADAQEVAPMSTWLNREIVSSLAKTLLTGILLALAVALLLSPEMDQIKATWATFYGDF